MSDKDADARQWIVEPPARGEITLHVAVGEGVQLTEAQEAAVGELLRTLETGDAEVSGYEGTCSAYLCNTVTCTGFNCPRLAYCNAFSSQATATGGAWNLMGKFGTVRR